MFPLDEECLLVLVSLLLKDHNLCDIRCGNLTIRRTSYGCSSYGLCSTSSWFPTWYARSTTRNATWIPRFPSPRNAPRVRPPHLYTNGANGTEHPHLDSVHPLGSQELCPSLLVRCPLGMYFCLASEFS